MRIERRTLPILVILSLCFLGSVEESWFNRRVTWKYGKEGLAWKTTIKEPNGRGEYQLVLQPLWVVEGGVVAIEIVIARPGQPEVNLLGERGEGAEPPFVITIEDLEQGLDKSKFGAVRAFQVNDMAVNVKIERFRFGKGLGSGSTYCADCNNLQELSMWITVKSKHN